jgi:glycosyltransferase involved in cell wall biosynthesis
MKIHAHIIAWNEVRILPFTLDHYSKFCEKIFVYDNMSDDGSDEIYKKYDNVSVIKWQNPDGMYDELQQVNIRNSAYKNSRSKGADWVIVCDCDEILYHPNLLDKLEEYKTLGVTVPKIDGHDMFSEEFPEYDGEPITDKVKIGSDVYDVMSKNIIFDPKLDIKFGIGSHSFRAQNGTFSNEPELKLLHYKFLGKEYVLWRYEMLAKRRNEQMKQTGLSGHWTRPPMKYMDEMKEKQFKVI